MADSPYPIESLVTGLLFGLLLADANRDQSLLGRIEPVVDDDGVFQKTIEVTVGVHKVAVEVTEIVNTDHILATEGSPQ